MHRPPRATVPVALLAAVLASVPAAAGPPVGLAVPPGVAPGVVVGCSLGVRYFDSLRTGPVGYCRGHLAYEPGAVDCYQYTDEICTVFLPESAQWTQTRTASPPVLFPCPDAPKPPVCPRLTWR